MQFFVLGTVYKHFTYLLQISMCSLFKCRLLSSLHISSFMSFWPMFGHFYKFHLLTYLFNFPGHNLQTNLPATSEDVCLVDVIYS